jgi:hypothetical protein
MPLGLFLPLAQDAAPDSHFSAVSRSMPSYTISSSCVTR